MPAKKIKSSQGFTLIELLIVIVIIGILATLATVSVQSVRNRAKDARRISDIKQLRTALELYFNSAGGYPDVITPGRSLEFDGGVFINKIPSNPDSGPYGDLCAGGDYSYVKTGNAYQIYWCLGNNVSDLPAGECVATPDTMCSAVSPINFGSGSDLDLTVSGTTNLSSNDNTGRGCADAASFKVSAISGKILTLSTTPNSGCFQAGSDVLIINLQGYWNISTNAVTYDNVGNYEIAKVSSVSGTSLTLSKNLTKSYGDPATQKIIVQRLPQYQDVAVNGTLTADAWDGTKGGVLAFKVAGTLSGNGTITMSNKGYRGGQNSYTAANTTSEPGEGLVGVWSGPQACTYQENVGGGGGGHRGYYYGGDGGAGGGYANGGNNATNDSSSDNGCWGCSCDFAGHTVTNCCRVSGNGGISYGQASLGTLFFGSGGGAGGGWSSYNNNPTNGDRGGAGGGIILITANDIQSTLNIVSNGSNATVIHSMIGAGGGAGGSILLQAKNINGSITLTANKGLRTNGGFSTYWGGYGGDGSVGRSAVYTCAGNFSSGSPTAYAGTLSPILCN